MYLKRGTTGSEEIRLATLLSGATPPAGHSRNHCVPILDVFQDDVDPTISYLVMPFLRLVDDPPFSTVADVVDFVDQILEVSAQILTI